MSAYMVVGRKKHHRCGIVGAYVSFTGSVPLSSLLHTDR